jgi:hypothetical protein
MHADHSQHARHQCWRTRLTLWTSIGHRFIAMGAAGWHICFDVLDHLLSGTPIGRIAGPEAMKFGGWQRLNAEYAKQFGIETPNWPSQKRRHQSTLRGWLTMVLVERNALRELFRCPRRWKRGTAQSR